MKRKFLIGLCLILLVFSCTLGLVACKHEHSWSAEWQTDETYHWHSCTTKKNCKEEYDKAVHTFSQDKDNFYHWQECDVCGYIKGKEEHTLDSNLTCTTCGMAHTHSMCYNDKMHMYTCVGCGLLGQESAHSFLNGVCVVCGYVQGTKELEFEQNSDGTYKVVGIDSDIEKPITNVIIPEYYEDEKVTVIGANAFYGNISMNKITIPSTIKTIENNAFARCFGLAEIVIPDSVNKIGTGVFEDCYGLTIKAEAKSAPSGWNTSDWQITQWCDIPVVWDCKNNDATKDGSIYFLNEVENYANSVKYVIKGDKAYIAKQPRILAKNIRTGKLEDRDFLEFKATVYYKNKQYSVIGVEDYALYNYESIEAIDIPAAYTKIGANAFEGCTNLREVEWGEDPTREYEVEIGMCAFMNAINLNNISLPNKVVKIGGYAFSGCTRLKEIVIPSSVKEVREGAFEYCIAIVIKCDVASQPEGWDSKWNIDNRPVIWDANSGNVSTGDGKIVYERGSAVYLLNTADHTATLLSQGELLGYNDLTLASEIFYPGDDNGYKLTAIGASAFADETSFTSIVIPEGVESIGDYAFSGCTNIVKITFAGNKITKIGANAFAGCEQLAQFEFAGTEEEWKTIEKGANWDLNTAAYKIVLDDGTTIDKTNNTNN